MTSTGDESTRPGTTTDTLTEFERARQQAHQDKIKAVLAAGLVAESLTTCARFELPAPIDLPDDLPDDDRYRLLAVEVTARRSLGIRPQDPETVPGEPPYLAVHGLVRDLKKDGTPHPQRYERWVQLPTELAEPLLGRAHVS